MTDVRLVQTSILRITGTNKLLRTAPIRLTSHVDKLIVPVTEANFELPGGSSRLGKDTRTVSLLQQKQMIIIYQLKLPIAHDNFHM
jgi:hypothetical protein